MDVFRKSSRFVRAIAYVASFSVFASPFHAIAAEIRIHEAAGQGQSLADMLLRDMKSPNMQSGTIVFPDLKKEGHEFEDIDNELSIQDLYPGTSGTTGRDNSFFSSGGEGYGAAEQNHNNGYQLDEKGYNKQYHLYEDAVSGAEIELGYTKNLDSSPSIEGAAYKIILDKKNAARPDLRNDPGINASRDIINDTEGSDFSDCKIEQLLVERNENIWLKDIHQCERIKEYVGIYEVTQDYTTEVVRYTDGSPNYESCGSGCLSIWVGTVGDNYWSGNCRIFEEYTAFKVINEEAIISATIKQAKFDDYFQIYLGGEKIWSHTPGVFPPETEGVCERSTSWNVDVGLDVTDHFKESAGEIQFRTRTSVTGGGEGYARIEIRFDPSKVFRTSGWMPAENRDMFDVVEGAVCKKKEFQCTAPNDLGPTDCIISNGVEICPQDLSSDIKQYDFISPFCRAATFDLDCSPHIGEMGCWVNASTGEEECHYNEGDQSLDTCKALEQQGCGFIKSECMLEAPNGACMIYNEDWDCGKYVTNPNAQYAEEMTCDGAISCLGESCIRVDREASDSFGKAAALLNVVEHADGLMECVETPNDYGENNPGEIIDVSHADKCTIFKGEKGKCKKAFGGTVDCCERPKGISIADYLTMLQAMKKIDSALVAVRQAQGTVGGELLTKFRFPENGIYSSIKGKAVDGFKTITKPFVNYSETATASITEKATNYAVEKALQFAEEILGEAAKEFTAGVLEKIGYDGAVQAATGTAAGEAGQQVGTEAGQTAARSMGQTVGSVIAVIGWIYLAYQVAMLIIQMVYKCTKSELELMVNVSLKKCTYLGSYCDKKILGVCTVKKQGYCCYDSPLARIVVEQGGRQIGKSQGTAKNPQCDGLTIGELQLLDWDKIDLSEWTGMLIEHNLYAGTNTLDPESITGSGSFLPGEDGGKRPDVKERTEARFQGGNIDDIRTDLSQKMNFSGGAGN